MYNILNHQLAADSASPAVTQTASSNHNGLITPQFVIIHYTACTYDDACSTFLRTTGSNRTSAHLLINTDGSITQFVDFNKRAWHAGISSWQDLNDINTHSIGIEIVNHGYLQRTASNTFLTSSGMPSPVSADEIVEARHKLPTCSYTYWQAFKPEQIEACGAVVQALFEHYATLKDVLGHDDIAPSRKVDPGPAFPMIKIRSLALGRDTEIPSPGSDIAYVAVAKLNIRSGPGVHNPKVSETPLPAQTRLIVLERNSGWLKVTVDAQDSVTGWVLADYTRSTAF